MYAENRSKMQKLLGVKGLTGTPFQYKKMYFFPFISTNTKSNCHFSLFVANGFKGAMSRPVHVREEALHLENGRQLFQVLRVIQY